MKPQLSGATKQNNLANSNPFQFSSRQQVDRWGTKGVRQFKNVSLELTMIIDMKYIVYGSKNKKI